MKNLKQGKGTESAPGGGARSVDKVDEEGQSGTFERRLKGHGDQSQQREQQGIGHKTVDLGKARWPWRLGRGWGGEGGGTGRGGESGLALS